MAKVQIFFMLTIAALLSVGTLADKFGRKECYEIHPEILCENGDTSKCSDFCKKKFGPSTTVQCIENVGFQGPFCVCNAC
ncbi:UNVERIFIED_CONTAM: hypothetical protein Sindi_1075700 [Sesamum indicum]